MNGRRLHFFPGIGILCVLTWFPGPLNRVMAQDIGFGIGANKAGIIDNAIPGDALTIRYDAAYNFNHADRAEFYTAKPAALGGDGLPNPERSIDFQDALVRLESMLWFEDVSGFIEVPVRHIEATGNTDTTGFSDIGFGLKHLWICNPDFVLTGQIRGWLPTGDGGLGLGNEHFTLEPGVLWFNPISDSTASFGELRYWQPLGGSDFAGGIFRYGLGIQKRFGPSDCWNISPVAELVGWTVVDGKTTVPSNAAPQVVTSATGDSILNAQLGARLAYADSGDLYIGYGRNLTGDRWFSDLLRLEFRLLF